MKNRFKKMSAVFLALMTAASLAACNGAAGNSAAGSGAVKSSETNTGLPSGNTAAVEGVSESASESVSENGVEPDGGNRSDDSAEAPSGDESSSHILVAYFSLAGEQYNVGVIEEGNTSIIARMIAGQTGADLFEIEAAVPYPDTHSALLDVSRQEMADHARPEIAGTVENMEDYDTVFIGYPNWWGDMPMIVYNFIESYDFSGKTVVPFCTHGGSGLSGTERAIADITGASMVDGFAISGETAQNDRDRSQAEVTAWLQEVGFIE